MATDRSTSTLTATSVPTGTLTALEPRLRLETLTLAEWLVLHPGLLVTDALWDPREWEAPEPLRN